MSATTNDTAEGSPISGRFELTADDVVCAYQLSARSQLWSRASVVSLAVTLALIWVLLAVTIHDPLAVAVITAGSLVGGLLVPRAIIRWRLPGRARKIYAQQRSLHDPVDAVFSQEGVMIATPISTTRLPWSNYMRRREDANIVLLYQSDAIFQMVPRRALSERDWQRVRDWLDQGIEARAAKST